MTEPTPLPLSSGSPESHAADHHTTTSIAPSARASTGCCGGSSHAPSQEAAPLLQAATPELQASGSCGSQAEKTSCSSEGLAHSTHAHVSHDSHSHVSHESPAVHAHESHVVHAHESHVAHASSTHEVATARLAHEAAHEAHAVSHAVTPTAAPSLEIAAASVATLAPPATETRTAPDSRELHGHAGSLTPLTDATAQDIEAALRSAQKARASQAVAQAARPRGSDLIARKLVLRRDRWDSLLKLTNALRAQRGIVATPAEVAAIVLDAGLNVILEESAQASRPAAPSMTPVSINAAPVAPVLKGRGRRAAAPLAAAPVVTPAAAAAPAELAPTAIEPVAAAPVAAGGLQVAIKSRTFHGAEIAHIRKCVRGLPSARSIQRTLGLWLGANVSGQPSSGLNVGVPIEDLRALCREFKVYDTANFAQNMKKDAAFFAEVRAPQSGDRLGYDLTPKGREAAASFLLVAAAPVKLFAKKSPAKKPAKATKAAVKKSTSKAPTGWNKSSAKALAKASAKRRGK